jgi:DNA-binding transcriptional ArsR family regulator
MTMRRAGTDCCGPHQKPGNFRGLETACHTFPDIRPLDRRHHFDNTRNMETLTAAEILAALGHESRLAIFRLLVEAGPTGINAGTIGEHLGMAPATLSFHLAHLSRVGLILGERESRFIRYSANYPAMNELIAFLTANCCQGNACLPKTTCCEPGERSQTDTEETN